MFSWLLQSSGVIDNPTTGDHRPGIIVGPNIDYSTLLAGFCIGFITAIILWGIIKGLKKLIAYSEKPIENPIDKKSDE